MNFKILTTADTPLSALFRVHVYDKLETVINAWRPFLVNNDPTVAALQMTHFQFDHQRFQSKRAYLDLMDVVKMDGLLVSLHALADYLDAHSNLSSSATTIYQSLKTVHKVLQK